MASSLKNLRSLASTTALVRGFHTTSINLARHSNKRIGKSVSDPPINPAPKSEFFNSLPSPLAIAAKLKRSALGQETLATSETDKLQANIGEDETAFLKKTIPDALSTSLQQISEKSGLLSRADIVLQTLSLDNANARAVASYNKLQCVQKFGTNEADTGSPEVQAAIWTLRIRNLEQHMGSHHKDFHNQRQLVKMYHKRAKMLKYLKRKSLPRYFECIKSLGITTEMVEGQISIRQKHN